jgi:hypothetical protein
MSSQPVTFYWQQIDHVMANLELGKLSQEIRLLTVDDEQRIRFQNIGNGNDMAVPSERLHMHLLRSDEWAARTYELYCEVWQAQLKPLSPEFLRAISKNGIRTLISGRINAVTHEFEMEQRRTHSHDPQWLKPATEAFCRDMERLYAKWEHAAEIDARGLGYMLAETPTNRALNLAAREIVESRARARTLAAMIASVDARIEMAERALNGMLTRKTPAYRIKNVKQSLKKLNTYKKELRSSLSEWQLRVKTAQRRAEGLYHGLASWDPTPKTTQSPVPEYSSRHRPRRVQHSRTVPQKSRRVAIKSPLNYRSPLKRAIMAQLIRDPGSSDLKICHSIDADAIDLPTTWLVAKNRLCLIAYRDPKVRPRIHSEISKVRADLLRHGVIR